MRSNIHHFNSFVNTDYALAHALSGADNLRWIRLSYDIWCSYHKNLKKRFSQHFPHAAKLLDNMQGAIPKMHIKNHIEACQLLWAFNYLGYTGETCGELIETCWSEGNQAAGSTKEMNDGHRHDMLDEYHGYWNWTKTHRLGMQIMNLSTWLAYLTVIKASSLYTAYNSCLDILKTRETKFRNWHRAIHPEHLEKWSSMDDTPQKRGKQIISVHIARYKKGMFRFVDMFEDFTESCFGFQDHRRRKGLTKPCWHLKRRLMTPQDMA